jgi:competence protein ComEC
VTLTGFVETRDIRERTDRFVLRVATMESPRGNLTLTRVRLSVKKGTAPGVGSFVALKARLLPPLAPLRPGSYDFARDMFFQGIGASGFAMGAIKTVAPPQSGGWRLSYAAFMQGLRDTIDARIRSRLAGDERAIATALLTGRRDAITDPVNDAMFISGLGHVLSISGYHMAVVAGVVFFAVRALLALIPGLAASHPIKKWSAAAALAAAAFYLLLSGADVATQRSFFMTAVVLIAVMVDRRAITFRTLAVAALIVLVMAPEALVHPSFQMSFAATLGLVALVQIGMPRLFATPDSSIASRIALWGGREVAVLLVASFVAGLATTPYAAFHFHRVTPYGVLANLAAMPVVSAVVMPAGLLGLLTAPFGLDGWCWSAMGWGIDWMIAVTRWVAALPGAVGRVTAFGIMPLIAMSLGLILIGLLRTPLRWSGAVVLASGVVWALALPQPDVLISADGRNVAVRGRDGALHMMRTGKDAFLFKEWLAADADARLPTDPSLSAGVSCDDLGCVAAMADGRLVALSLRSEAVADDCARAALVVTSRQAPSSCAASVIDRERLQHQGALALRRQREGQEPRQREGKREGIAFAVEAVRPNGIDRPWWPAAADGGEFDATLVPRSAAPAPTAAPTAATVPAPARWQDATPAEPDQQQED